MTLHKLARVLTHCDLPRFLTLTSVVIFGQHFKTRAPTAAQGRDIRSCKKNKVLTSPKSALGSIGVKKKWERFETRIENFNQKREIKF